MNLNELQRLAEGATPGRWHLIRAGLRDGAAIATIEPAPETMTEPNYWTVASVNTLREEWATNAAYIAALHNAGDKLIAAARAALALLPILEEHLFERGPEEEALRTALEELK